MIDFVRSYHNDKTQLEDTVLNGDLFDDVRRTIDPKTGETIYPITSSCDGFFVSIDRYRAYINCVIKAILYNFSKVKLRSSKNFSFSDLKTAVNSINAVSDHDETKLSGIHVGFVIPTTIAGKEIIKMNVLMHKYKYCNHDLMKNTKEHIKEFVSHNYKIGFYSYKNPENENFLKIVLKLNKSAEFSKYEIKSLNDLIQKKKLIDLFKLFMKRFDEMIIIDSFESFEGDDYRALQEFLNYGYWKKLAKTKSRQTQSRHKKKFEALIYKYHLDSQKIELKKELNNAFTRFISN